MYELVVDSPKINSQKLNSQKDKAYFPLTLAPMVGLSHVALRKLIKNYSPSDEIMPTLWPTEMLSTWKLPKEDLNKTAETLKSHGEVNLIPQILGNEEKPIQLSVARLINEWGASGIDINMGCPVKKALKHNYGVSLMGDADYAAKVVEITKKYCTLPVSVKLRAVANENGELSFEELLRFVKKLEQAGADRITLHPRTASQQRRGSADWTQIKELKKHMQIPIWGNGDIQVSDDVISMLSQTDADMVMSGRALAARPWMMWQLMEDLDIERPLHLQGLKAPRTETEEGAEYGKCLLRLIDYAEEFFCAGAGLPDSLALRKVQFHIRTTHVWLLFGHSLMALSTRAKNLKELRELVQIFFSQEQVMNCKTELRQ